MMPNTEAIGSHIAVLSYHDHSGLIGVWGPFPSRTAAEAAIEWLKQLPLQGGIWSAEPLLSFAAPQIMERETGG